MRNKALTRQIVIRVPEALYEALAADAEAHGRTVAQGARFLLRVSLAPGGDR